ncbi:MAG TPA: hypothetical protein VKX34_08585 [Aequorivita sp.]|nr:hypothetical protein [Aequorivita sp.]
MANKIYKLFEYFYLIVAVFFSYETINNWTENRDRAYLYLFFVAIAIFMFFFRRKFRKKMEDRSEK